MHLNFLTILDDDWVDLKKRIKLHSATTHTIMRKKSVSEEEFSGDVQIEHQFVTLLAPN